MSSANSLFYRNIPESYHSDSIFSQHLINKYINNKYTINPSTPMITVQNNTKYQQFFTPCRFLHSLYNKCTNGLINVCSKGSIPIKVLPVIWTTEWLKYYNSRCNEVIKNNNDSIIKQTLLDMYTSLCYQF